MANATTSHTYRIIFHKEEVLILIIVANDENTLKNVKKKKKCWPRRGELVLHPTNYFKSSGFTSLGSYFAFN